jgi:hypothetical protein
VRQAGVRGAPHAVEADLKPAAARLGGRAHERVAHLLGRAELPRVEVLDGHALGRQTGLQFEGAGADLDAARRLVGQRRAQTGVAHPAPRAGDVGPDLDGKRRRGGHGHLSGFPSGADRTPPSALAGPGAGVAPRA